MDISLIPEFEQLVDELVKSKQYPSASSVVQHGLQLLKDSELYYQERTAELQKEISIGVEQADRGELIDGEQAMKELMEEIDRASEVLS